jgi:hypothetical protein
MHGYVVDFLDFHAMGWHFPAFNVADAAITVGAVCLILDELLCRAARVFFTSTSTIAASVLAARSALRASSSSPSFLAWVSTAVLSPANEKSRSPLCSKGRGSLKALRIALLRHARQGRPAGVAQAHELGGFVKGFARRVVNGFAQNFVAAHAIHPHELGVAARHQQCDKGELRRVSAQEGREQMPLQVVHAQHGLAQRRAQGAGHARAHQQRPGQAGARV